MDEADYIRYKMLEKKQSQEEKYNNIIEKSKKYILPSLQGKNPQYDVCSEQLSYQFLKYNKLYTIRSDQKREMWIYRYGIYVEHAETYVKEFLRDVLGIFYEKQILNMTLDKLEADTFIDQDVFFPSEDYLLDKICVQNGVLNLNTKELEKFSPDYFFFSKLPVYYSPDSKCEIIIDFFKEVLECKEDVRVMQEFFGYLLHRSYNLSAKGVMMNGDGRNGKGKTLEIIRRFIGAENTSSVPLQKLSEDKYSLSELHNKLANIGGDLSDKYIDDDSMYKTLTGKDTINANRKYKVDIQFVNYAKMIFSCNKLPSFKDMTTSIWNRWILFEFNKVFADKEDFDNLSNEKFMEKYKKEKNNRNTKIADTDLISKLITNETLSGLLNWALDGLKRLKIQSGFSLSPAQTDVKKRWMRKANSLYAFIEDNCEIEYENYIIKSVFRTDYNEYCKIHKIPILSDKKIKYTLEQFGVFEDRKSIDSGVREHIWNGINVKSGQGGQGGQGI